MPAHLPVFLGIGTQKGGTTSLHDWLNNHPEVFLPKCKEIHFFDQNYLKGSEWYLNQFKEAGKEQKCGEITPMYLFHPEAPIRIHKLLPDIKLIAILRDPAERTISQILHARQRKFETLNPWEALAAEEKRLKSGDAETIQKHSYISRSKYIEQLERYEKIFKKNQLLIIKSEDLFSKAYSKKEEILRFLGIKKIQKNLELPRANQSRSDKGIITDELRQAIRAELLETAQGVRKKYGFGWEWA